MMGKLDKKDLKILEILQHNARTPFLEIARVLKVSEATVRKHVRRLEQDGVLKRYTIEIDPRKLGYGTVALVGLDARPEKFLNVLGALTEIPEVRRVMTSTGDHMIMIEVWARDNRHLSRLIKNHIARIEGVSRVCPSILIEQIK